MNFDKNAQQAFDAYAGDPGNQRTLYALGMLYWNTLVERIGAVIRDGGDVHEFLQNEREFLDFGITAELLGDDAGIRERTAAPRTPYKHLQVNCVSDWLAGLMEDISETGRRRLIERDMRGARLAIKRLEKEALSLAEARKKILLEELTGKSASLTANAVGAHADKMIEIDQMALESLKRKKSISRGVFFSVEQRREFVQRENKLQKLKARQEALLGQVQAAEARKNLREQETRLAQVFAEIVEQEEAVAQLENEAEELEKKTQAISATEIANRAQREIEYLRDLVKLCAKRLRQESCSLLKPGDTFFTWSELTQCLDRVLEFDPRVFSNDRVVYLGKPSVLLVPGNGNAMYDWKNNQLIVPLVPPAGNFMGSIATAIIEYRLDVDEDKKLLTSYNKLPSMKDVRSLFQLKGKLVKEYIIWMTSEYKGFRVLPKESKGWFEHEIAPSKNDIYCPPEYQQFNLSSKEFRELLDELDSRLGNGASADIEETWVASVLHFQQGNFDKAYDCIVSVLQEEPDRLFAHYNLGHIGVKAARKQEAITGFSEFARRWPQSWWAGVARENVRRLQMG
jgi:tetratricopeptide (TPR) repeat protein